jgi:hypothetical protein
MKNALLLPLRYIAILLTCAALFIVAQMGIDILPSLSWAERASVYLTKASAAFPSLVLLTLFISSFIPLRHKSNTWVSFLILFTLTAGCLFLSTAFYTGTREGIVGSQESSVELTPLSPKGINRLIDSKAWIGINGNIALQADFSSGKERILTVSTITANKGEPQAAVKKQSFLEKMEDRLSTVFISPQDLFIARVSLIKKAITCLAFAFFLCSTSAFLRISDWKLFSALIFFCVFWGGVTLTGIVFDSGFSSMVGNFLPQTLKDYVSDGIIAFIGFCLFLFSVFYSLSKTARGEE